MPAPKKRGDLEWDRPGYESQVSGLLHDLSQLPADDPVTDGKARFESLSCLAHPSRPASTVNDRGQSHIGCFGRTGVRAWQADLLREHWSHVPRIGSDARWRR